MRKLHIPMIILTLLLVSCAGAKKDITPYKGPLKATSIEKQIHKLINAERKKEGLKTLKLDKKLSSIARGHSADMGRRGYFSHYSPEGKDFVYRYEQGGYECAIKEGTYIYGGAENIFSVLFTGSRSEELVASDTVEGWMHSTGHRKNILTPRWGREGIGVHIVVEDGMRVVVYVTQNFC